MSTLREVAALAGVSTITASRALRSFRYVNAHTRTRVQQAAEQLGYQVDSRLSEVMSKVRLGRREGFRETISFIWPDSAPVPNQRPPYVESYVRGARTRALQRGYALDEFSLAGNLTKARLISILTARGIRGVVFGPFLRASKAHLHFPFERFATAVVGEALAEPRLHRSRSDHALIVRTALHHLKNLGYKRVALIIDPLTNRRASRAFESAFLTAHPLGPEGALRLYLESREDPTRHSGWLREVAADALLISYDVPLAEFAGRGIRVPEDLAIASLNLESNTSPYAGVAQAEDVVASHAVDLVVEQFHAGVFGVPAVPKTVLTEGAWRDGRTAPRRRR